MGATIRPTQVCLESSHPPPTFEVTTDGRPHFSVEVTTNNLLFNGANQSRRNRRNFFSTRQGQPALGVAGQELAAPIGWATYTLPPAVWRQFRTQPHLYYRVIAFDLHASRPRALSYSTTDSSWRLSPWLIQRCAVVRHHTLQTNISGRLPWLKVEGNKLVKRGTNSPVVLRGVNFSGLNYRQAGWPPPEGGSATRNFREAAGITEARVQEIAGAWNAKIIRLPLNQDWVLRGVGPFSNQVYLQDIDQIIRWAANAGMYTLLDLQNLDVDPRNPYGYFIRHGRRQNNYIAPMPDNLSLSFWERLASRYKNQPAVLYDIHNEPHPPLGNDGRYPRYLRPATQAGWIRMWHEWVRKIERVIHCVHPDAVLFISGWNWALDLSSMPVPLPGGTYVPNAVYSTHVYYHGSGHPRRTDREDDWRHWFAFRRLRLVHPIFIGEWGGVSGELEWGHWLETYLRTLHRMSSGKWQGLAGWTAWSWADYPYLVRRLSTSPPGTDRPFVTRTRVVAGKRRTEHIPTDFGELVMCALSKPDTQANTGFNPLAGPGNRCPG
jgi:hypothetical protein